MFRTSGNESVLSNAVVNCSQGQLAFAALDDVNCNDAIFFELTVVNPVLASGFADAVQPPTVETIGNLTLVGQVDLSTAGRATFTVRMDPALNINDEFRCGAAILTYEVLPTTAQADLVTNSSLLASRNGNSANNCQPTGQQELWEFNNVNPPFAFNVLAPTTFNNTNLNFAQLDQAGPIILINGDVTYTSSSWPTSGGFSGGSQFLMGPDATFSFGDQDNIVSGLTVPNGRFFPCSSDRFNTVEIGPDSEVTFDNSFTNPNETPLVLGASTGVTVRESARFTMSDGVISSCNTGLRGERAWNISLTNVDINQTFGGVLPAFSSFVSDGSRGNTGINLRTTDESDPREGNYIFTGLTIDEFSTGLSSGISSDFRGPFYLLFEGSTISNCESGIEFRRAQGGQFVVRDNEIDADVIGIDYVANRNAGLEVFANTITSGVRGIRVFNYSSSFFGANLNEISGQTDYGIQSRSSGDLLSIGENTISLAPQSEIGAFGIGIFRNNRSSSSAFNNTITTGQNINNFGIFVQGSSLINASVNNVLLSESQSTGVVIADAFEVNTNCNQVTIGGTNTSSTGMELTTISGSINLCNSFSQTFNGLQILGSNAGASYTTNTFLGNEIGLLVGGLSNSSNNQSDVLIGGVQTDADNIWADNAQPDREARHLTDINLRSRNAFSVKQLPNLFPANGVAGPVVFQNIPSLDQWFIYSNSNSNPVACPSSCTTLPPGWVNSEPCLPADLAFQGSKYKTFQRQQARLNAKYINDSGQTACTDDVLPCYEEIADLEQQFYNIFGSSIDEDTYESYRDLLVTENGQGTNGFSPNFMENVITLISTDSPDEDIRFGELEDLLISLDEYQPCENVTSTWQESLVYAVKNELEAGLTEGELASFIAIANMCAGFDGPGVHIARASLGLAISDGQKCGSTQTSLPLTFKVDEVADDKLVFPNPVSVGGILSLQDARTGWIEIFDGLGRKVNTQYLEKSSTFNLPSSLGAGTYFIHTLDGTFSTTFVISE